VLAIVLGEGIAAITSALVLRQFFPEVLVLKSVDKPYQKTCQVARDTRSDHVHTLLAGGRNALNELIPGTNLSLEQLGAQSYEAGSDTTFVKDNQLYFDFAATVALPLKSGLFGSNQSRSLLASYLSQQLDRNGGRIRFADLDVVGFITCDNQLIGIRTYCNATGVFDKVNCQLLVDASGRKEVTKSVLKEVYKIEIPTSSLPLNVRYSSLFLSTEKKEDKLVKSQGFVCNDLQGSKAAAMLCIENGVRHLTLATPSVVREPLTLSEFKTSAFEIGGTRLSNQIQESEVLTKPSSMVVTEARFTHIEKANLPNGLILVGDALVSLDPHLGQGMSSIFIQLLVLRDMLLRLKKNNDDVIVHPATVSQISESALDAWYLTNILNNVHDLGSNFSAEPYREFQDRFTQVKQLAAKDQNSFLQLLSMLHLCNSKPRDNVALAFDTVTVAEY
jgi:2-polyprenyl-6-methoxyphenol hydroxylase-like FAD-dependent oxidoreductase